MFEQGRIGDRQGACLGGWIGGEENFGILRAGGFHCSEAERVGLAGLDVDFNRFIFCQGFGVWWRQIYGNDTCGDGKRRHYGQKGERDEALGIFAFHSYCHWSVGGGGGAGLIYGD